MQSIQQQTVYGCQLERENEKSIGKRSTVKIIPRYMAQPSDNLIQIPFVCPIMIENGKFNFDTQLLRYSYGVQEVKMSKAKGTLEINLFKYPQVEFPSVEYTMNKLKHLLSDTHPLYDTLQSFLITMEKYQKANCKVDGKFYPSADKKLKDINKYTSAKLERLLKRFPCSITKLAREDGSFQDISTNLNDKMIQLLGWNPEKLTSHILQNGVPAYVRLNDGEFQRFLKTFLQAQPPMSLSELRGYRSLSHPLTVCRRDQVIKNGSFKNYCLPTYENGRPVINLVRVINILDSNGDDSSLTSSSGSGQTSPSIPIHLPSRMKPINHKEQNQFLEKFYKEEFEQKQKYDVSKVCQIKILNEEDTRSN